jgi:hypothetical protein
MSETLENDHVAHRLVIALDALPVPDEPTGLGATAKPSLLRDPRMLLTAALLIVLVATLTSPQFERTAAQLTRYIERIVVGPGAWVGYYHDHNVRDMKGRPPVRLAVASGNAQGGPTTPDIVGANAYIGPWSPDGQQIAVSDGSQLYVGDQFGRLRPIAHVGLDYVVVPLGWNGNDKVWATVSTTPLAAPASFVTVDLKTGSLEYHRTDLPGGLVGPISPDGRWVRVALGPPGATDRCGFITSLYDLVARQVVDVVDANGRSAYWFGFLSDSRIVVGQCDRTVGKLELYVGAPGTRPSLIAGVPLTAPRPVVACCNGTDEIHVITSGPEAPQNVYVFDSSGRVLRMARLPQLALTGEFWAGLSRDGRFMSVEGGASVSEARAGVIDLWTGHVTYLCDSGCDYFSLR